MAIGIYKAGQGYWVRVLTASMLGILTLATAAWVWSQAQIAVEKLPKSIWTLPLASTEGDAPAAGTRVTLVAKPGQSVSAAPPAPGETIGTAEVIAYDAPARALKVKGVQLTKPTGDPSLTARVEGGGSGAAAFRASVAGLPLAATAIEPVVVQGAAVAVIMLIGAILIYWFVAMRPGSVEFLISTDTEMKKVNWSNKKDIKNSTMVVILACFLIAILLFIFDYVFQAFFRLIGILTT